MSNKKPVIALTPYFNIDQDEPYMRPAYLKAIRAAGGIPVILPLDLAESDLAQLVDTVDGILFTGGPDVHPFYFGEETQIHCGNVCLRRDRMELALLKLAMDEKKPIFGICRGVQLLNIGLGGDIYQDIPSQFHEEFPIAHTQPFAYDIPAHKVSVVQGTLLDRLTHLQATASNTSEAVFMLNVNSMHHQAVRRLAPGLIASAYALNQLIEAIEKPDYPTFFLGVQWHPEYLWENDPAIKQVWEAFVGAAKGE
ncbi:MAG: gamma-glutamyl-gamma-aminobutyrate hydrolase family protein [Lachnospiraceae bacterium]|nr:gamma-glutamyl-gamma-aminobutyrate hydrolase family protein [Lachnospiraceae bacterium]